MIAIAPLIITWVGLDHPEYATLILATIIGFFPLFSSHLTGLRALDPDFARLFQLYEAKPWQTLWYLRIASGLPFFLSGLKVAIGLCIIGAVVAEISAGSGASQGLAWKIVETTHQLRIAETFAALFTLSALAVALHWGVEKLESRLLKTFYGR